jgi:hypothetical protein
MEDDEGEKEVQSDDLVTTWKKGKRNSLDLGEASAFWFSY